MPVRSWATHQLAEFLATVSAYDDERAATLGAVERAAAALEAEVSAVVRDGSVVASIGFPAGEEPEDVLTRAARGDRELRELPDLGPCRTATAPLEGDPGGTLLLARLGDEEFDPQELNLLRAMARVLALSLRGLRRLATERELRQRAEDEATERRKAERRLATQYAVARVLADADTAGSAFVPLLKTLGRELGCAFGALWLFEDGSLRRVDVWREPTDAPGSSASPPDHPVDDGLAARARALLEGAPVRGAEGALAIPIAAGAGVTGAIELSCGELGAPDPPTLEMLAGVGTQVGQFLNRQLAEERLAHQAVHDALTGLPNRTLLRDRVEHALATASRTETSVAVLFLDIDRFKHVNDSLGHQAGDQVLPAFAERLTSIVRKADTVARAESTIARLGGDEFVVLCEHLRRERDAVRIAERIVAELEEPLIVDGAELAVTASIGIALAGPGEAGPEQLLRDADLAMYHRVLVARLPAALRARRAEARPLVHREPRGRRPQPQARRRHDRHGARVRDGHRGRGGRDRGPAPVPARARLPARPGLPVRASRPARRPRTIAQRGG